MHREVDAEALLGAIDEFLAESGADVDIRQRLAVAHDRRHAENRERFATRFDADDRLAGLDRFHHGGAARGDVVAEHLRRVDAVERGGGACQNVISGMPCAFIASMASPSSAPSPSRSPLAMASPTGGRAAITAADRQRGAALIVDRGDHAVILQLELLIERELRQRALLDNREGAEDGAGGGATVSEMARIRRTAIDRILNMGEPKLQERSSQVPGNCLTTRRSQSVKLPIAQVCRGSSACL